MLWIDGLQSVRSYLEHLGLKRGDQIGHRPACNADSQCQLIRCRCEWRSTERQQSELSTDGAWPEDHFKGIGGLWRVSCRSTCPSGFPGGPGLCSRHIRVRCRAIRCGVEGRRSELRCGTGWSNAGAPGIRSQVSDDRKEHDRTGNDSRECAFPTILLQRAHSR